MSKIIILSIALLFLSCQKEKERVLTDYLNEKQTAILSAKSEGKNNYLFNQFQIGFNKLQYRNFVDKLVKSDLMEVENDSVFYFKLPDFDEPERKIFFRFFPWFRNDSLIGTIFRIEGTRFSSDYYHYERLLREKYGEPITTFYSNSKVIEGLGGKIYPSNSKQAFWINENITIEISDMYFSDAKPEEEYYVMFIRYKYLPTEKNNERKSIAEEKEKERLESEKLLKIQNEKKRADSLRNVSF
ncbi:MAG: hypothetical protein JJE55_15740 [Flavobacteriaceae bacterium]|nr:hypothetical protein [Flavobacteriaceae bacterium]